MSMDLDLAAIVADLDRVDAAQREAAKRARGALVVAWLIDRQRGPFLGGEYYRALRPAALMASRHGWHTAVCDSANLIEGQERVFCTVVGPGAHLIAPDVLVVRPLDFSAQMELDGKPFTFADLVDAAHAAGQKVIADLDDDIWAHEDWTPESRPNDDGYEDWCWKVDGWLVSTVVIKRRVSSLAARRGLHPPIVVAPNCYDVHGVGNLRARPGRMLGNRLFLEGRMRADIAMYEEMVFPLLGELDVEFVHVGASAGHRFPSAALLVERSSVILPQLAEQMRDVSIGVICHGDHPYNDAKTETNAVELASMGIPLVAATRHRLYTSVPGRVEPTAAAIRRRVEALLDPTFWHKESARARQWAEAKAEESETRYVNAFARLSQLVASA